MFLTDKDNQFSSLSSCWKRAETFGRPMSENCTVSKHRLQIAWSNCKMMLDASDESKNDLAFDIQIMSWFSKQVEDFSKTNMLAVDPIAAGILWEWKKRMFFNPTKLVAARNNAKLAT
jgi:hypothetical protein